MRSPRLAGAAVLCTLTLAGCGGAAASVAPSTPSATPSRDVQVGATFTTTLGTAITYDQALVPSGGRGAVSSETGDGGTTVTLAVRGLEPERSYGAHAHTQPCGATGEEAGPHFQHEVDPVQPSVDPAYANPQNEIWLDLTTDDAGSGTATTTVDWAFTRDGARSVIIHEMPTATEPGQAGTAGTRAACISVEF